MANQKDFRVKNGLVVEEGAVISGLTYPINDGDAGHILTTDGNGNLTFQLNPISAAMGEPMGFVARTDSTISFTDGTRTFTIAPVSTSYEVWTKGVKRTKTTSASVVIPNTSGLYYIYFDASGNLQQQSSFFNLQEQTPVAYIYWNATTSSAPFVADERHGVVMDWRTHEYLHRTRGAVIASGFGASNYVVGGNGSLNTHMQLDLAGGTFFDEDLRVDITHSNTPTNIWEQDLQGPARIPMFYLDGAGEWKIDSPTDYPVKQGTARPQYNLNTAGTWSTADIAENKYGVTFILATNNIAYPVIGIIGQEARDTQGDAEALSWGDLVLTGFPVVEFRPLYKIVYRCSSAMANTPKASLVSIWDLRNLTATTVSAYNPTDHGNLSGLADDDHAQYVHISNPRTITAEHTFGGTQTFNDVSIGDDLSVGGDVTITGNLTVNGTQTILSTETLQVQDNIIVLNAEETGAPSANAGIEVERGTSTNTQIRWNESADKWQFTNDGSTYYDFIPLAPSAGAGRVLQANAGGTTFEFGDIVLGSQSRDTFTGNGSQTVFTLTNTYGGQNSVLVFVDGVIQYPGANFTLSGTTLTFLGAPVASARIEVFGLTPVTSEVTPGDGTVTAKKLAASAYTRDIFTGNGSTTTFNLTGDVGTELAPFVFVGGILQDPISAYSINVVSVPQTITFTEAIPSSTEVVVVYGPVNVTGVPSDGTVSFQKMASSVFNYDTFTGNGSQTVFTLSQTALSAKHVLVSVASVLQTPETAYTISGTTLTFSAAPANGASIVARFFVGGTVGVPSDNSVSTIKIQDSAVTTAKLADLSVTTAKLAAAAVTTAKIANSAITTALIADGSITSDKIANGTVIAADILDGTITKAKLNFNPEDDAVALAIALG